MTDAVCGTKSTTYAMPVEQQRTELIMSDQENGPAVLCDGYWCWGTFSYIHLDSSLVGKKIREVRLLRPHVTSDDDAPEPGQRDMINEEWRYFAPGGDAMPGEPSTWYILDWDQRHIIAVTMEEEQESEDVAIKHLKRHIDTLGLDIYAIELSQNGELVSVSTNPEDDQGTCVYYPPLETIERPSHVKTVQRSDLLELDRLGPSVDLVSYTSPSKGKETTKVVFKYYFLFQFIHKIWHEMNLWMRLPPHPHIVPFGRLVVDVLFGHVFGFTSLYIPGGTLRENPSRIFKFKWLRQLTCVVDDLNLKYGIAHQDIAPRNLLINPKTDDVMLFDFNYSGRIGGVGHRPDRNDIKGVIFTLYDIISRDMHFRDVPYHEHNTADVQGLVEWTQHPDVKLDHPVSEFRSVLNEWVDKRHEGRHVAIHTEAPECIDWPDIPAPPPSDLVFSDGKGNPTIVKSVVLTSSRGDEREKGVKLLSWERPAQIKLGDDKRVLANGQFVPGTEHTDLDQTNS